MKDSPAPDPDDELPCRKRLNAELDGDSPKLSRSERAMRLQEVLDEQAAFSEESRTPKNNEPQRPSSHALNESDFDEDDDDTKGSIRPHDPDPKLKYTQYALTDEFQDKLLAAYLRHSEDFGQFHKVFSPTFFTGPVPCSVAFGIQAYIKQYNRVPDFSTLANFCYHRKVGDSERALEDRDYVIKLEKLDTADWKYARDHALSFAKRNALQRVMIDFVEAREKGEEDEIDWEDRFRQAKRFDNFGLPAVKDMATAPRVPKPDVLVEGLLHFSCKLALGGSSKASKSFLLLSLAVAVATGSEWLGMKCKKAKVLFVDFEIKEGFLQDRAEQIAEAMGVKLEPGWLSYQCLRGVSTPANEILPKIAALAGKDQGLVVIDPTYRMYDTKTNENDMSQIAGMMLEVEKVCERTGAAVALGTHFAKGDQSKKSSIDRIGGSRAFAADPDTILTLTELKEDDTYAVEATLRNFARPPKFGVRWKYPVFEIDPALDPEDLREPQDRSKYTDHDFLLPLIDGGLSKKAWGTAVVEATGMDNKTFDRRHKKLMHARKVGCKDGLFSLTPLGQQQMSKKVIEDDSSDSH